MQARDIISLVQVIATSHYPCSAKLSAGIEALQGWKARRKKATFLNFSSLGFGRGGFKEKSHLTHFKFSSFLRALQGLTASFHLVALFISAMGLLERLQQCNYILWGKVILTEKNAY